MLLFCLEYILFEGGCGYNESGKTKERGFVRTSRVKANWVCSYIKSRNPKDSKANGFCSYIEKGNTKDSRAIELARTSRVESL